MSTVFISVGQCGNQVGSAFWQRAAALPCASNSFFDEYGKARAILVDAEPKVVTGTMAHIKAPHLSGVADSRQQDDRQYGIFRRANVCLEQSGRGNNWALGYFGPGGKEGSDESLSARVLAALEKEVERCDMFTGCVLMHSTTGGTGSGLGSRLLEQLCDRYGTQFRLTNSVLPSLRAGDSTLQSYNSVLTLARLQQCTDAVIYADNDALWAQASGVALPRLARPVVYAPGHTPTEPVATRSSHANLGTAISNSVQIEDINRDMASGLVNFFSPWSLSSYQNQIVVPGIPLQPSLRPFQAFDLVQAAAPLPSLHFVEIYNSTGLGTKTSVDALGQIDHAKQLQSRVPVADLYGVHNRTIFQLSMARGRSEKATDASVARLDSCFNPCSTASVTRVAAPSVHTEAKSLGRPDHSTPSSMAVCLNRTRIASCLDQVLSRAQNLFNARAFLHWYLKHGCEEDDFREAFEVTRTVIDDYSSFIHHSSEANA